MCIEEEERQMEGLGLGHQVPVIPGSGRDQQVRPQRQDRLPAGGQHTAHPGSCPCLGRKVAKLSHADHPVSGAQGEESLRHARGERNDSARKFRDSYRSTDSIDPDPVQQIGPGETGATRILQKQGARQSDWNQHGWGGTPNESAGPLQVEPRTRGTVTPPGNASLLRHRRVTRGPEPDRSSPR